MKTKLLISAYLFAHILTGCSTESTDDKQIRMTIASEQIYHPNILEGRDVLCYLVKIEDSTTWEPLSDTIEGFEYTSGYEYEIIVRLQYIAEPMQDDSDRTYHFKRVISKVMKESENIPANK